jgi:hypothetical protein
MGSEQAMIACGASTLKINSMKQQHSQLGEMTADNPSIHMLCMLLLHHAGFDLHI